MTRAQQILSEVGRLSNQVIRRSRPIATEVFRQIWAGLKRADDQLDRWIRQRVPRSEASLYKTLSLVLISVVGLLLLPLTFTVFLIVAIILTVKTALGFKPSSPPRRSSRRLLRDGEERYGRDMDDPPRRRRY